MRQLKSCSLELNTLKKELRKSKKQVYRLKGYCELAAAQKDCAMTKFRETLLKDKSAHNLLHKGVYTEETRNLIWLLVKAGCSKDYTGQVIFAVLKSAGITAIGSISCRTVSRVLVEGWVATQIQSGYEMLEAECQFL